MAFLFAHKQKEGGNRYGRVIVKAMHLLQGGVNLVYIRDLLGHTDLRTTEIYARAESEAKRQALEKASPIKSDSVFPSWTEDSGLLSWLQSLGKTER